MKPNLIGQAANFNILFRDSRFSSHSGILLLREFIESLGVCELLDSELKVKQRARGYSESESVMGLVYNMILGGSCLSDLAVLRGDPGSMKLLGYEKVIAATTAGEFLRKFDLGNISDLGRCLLKLQEKVRGYQKGDSCTIDMDASVYEQSSKLKEGTREAYNGEVGYNPLFSFWAEESEILFSHLLSGNRRACAKGIWFLKQTLKRVPKNGKLKLRADSEFYVWEFIEFCEKEGITYAISADKSVQMMERILQIKEEEWKKSKKYKKVQVAEFRYKPTNQKQRRFVVKRELAVDKKGRSFYRYHCVVTNDEKTPSDDLIQWYMQRATAENLIKEHKTGFSLEKLPTRSFLANWAYLLIGQLAFNLVAWFKKMVLPKEYRNATVKTIRHRILNLAGKIVSTGRQFYLILCNQYKYKLVWKYALKQLAKLKLVFAYP